MVLFRKAIKKLPQCWQFAVKSCRLADDVSLLESRPWASLRPIGRAWAFTCICLQMLARRRPHEEHVSSTVVSLSRCVARILDSISSSKLSSAELLSRSAFPRFESRLFWMDWDIFDSESLEAITEDVKFSAARGCVIESADIVFIVSLLVYCSRNVLSCCRFGSTLLWRCS